MPAADQEDLLVWRLVRDYIEAFGAVRHQIESYDHFVTHLLPHIVTENSDVSTCHSSGDVSHHLIFSNVTVCEPSARTSDGFERALDPHEARLGGHTYAARVTVDLVHDKVDQTQQPPRLLSRRVFPSVVICRLPVMLGSRLCRLTHRPDASGLECSLDRGGYFIINGIEKSLLAQEKLRTNYPYVFECRHPRFQYTCEVRSCHELKLRSTSTLYMHITRLSHGVMPEIFVVLPFLTVQIPLVALFRVLGARDTEEILEHVSCGPTGREVEHIVRSCLDSDVHARSSAEEILEWIGREGTTETTRERRARYLEHIFSNELLPHMGLRRGEHSDRRKMAFLGHMVHKLVHVSIGKLPPDDRDDYANKRVDTSGVLMSLLFRQHYRNFLKMLSMQLHRVVELGKDFNAGDLISHRKMTSGFGYAFATGNWGMQKGAGQTGVAQVLSRMTTVSAVSGLRRINTPIAREGKAPKPRQLHPTSWGVVCPVETPEGSSCGLVKNLALLAHVRVGCLSTPLAYAVLREPGFHVTPLLHQEGRDPSTDFALVFVNGVLVGSVESARVGALADALRRRRRSQSIPFDTSVAVTQGALHVGSDPGCLLRPLVIAERIADFWAALHDTHEPGSLWQRLLSEGVIEYLDKMEEATMRVAVRLRDVGAEGAAAYTHAEIHPSLINGLCASLIPFSDHNQAPRNTYQSAMGKQAVGLFATNFLYRMDALAHVLAYPQRALVSTQAEEMLGTSSVPAGASPLVVIMCYTGFNQEDSVIVNQAAIDRGLFRSFAYRTYKEVENAVGADAEHFENPSMLTECAGLRDAHYGKLAEDGIVHLGTRVGDGDAVIGKTLSTIEGGEGTGEPRREVRRDRSTVVRGSEESVVDAIFRTRTTEGNRCVKVRTRASRIPTIGDKLSSRHGQKGVIGMVLSQADMPFSEEGLSPDLIINPHAIPSRMTIGQLLECLLGKLCCAEGTVGDGTPFQGASIEAMADAMEAHGMQRYGRQVLYNGMTGERMEGLAFMGPTYYQRLKHMVVDKEHARARGPVQILTRQPIEGRSREGGLRFGEMERDAVISHGASSFLRDRLFEHSDPSVATVCKKCGLLCQPAAEGMLVRNARSYCGACGCSGEAVDVQVPYSFTLLTRELYAMSIAPRLRIDCLSAAEAGVLQS